MLSLWVLLSSSAACASLPPDASVAFEQGNAQLARGHYAQAIGAYRRLAQRGVGRAELYCNTGNAYYQAGQVGWAVFYYEKGLALAPLDAQLLANRRAALAKAGVRAAATSAPALLRRRLVLQVADWLAVVAVLGLVGSSMLFLSNAVAGPHPQQEKLWAWCRYGLLTSGLLVVAASGLALPYEQSGAIIVQAKTAGRAGPSGAARQVFEAKAGEKVTVKNRYQQWVKVQLPSGEEGWVAAASVASL